MQCEIKSKYLGNWQQRTINVNSEEECFLISSGEGTHQIKAIYFDDVKVCKIVAPTPDSEHYYFLILQHSTRQYQIRSKLQSNLQKIIDITNLWQLFKTFNQKEERVTSIPKCIQYKALRQLAENQDLSKHSTVADCSNQTVIQEFQEFYKSTDWRRDEVDGGLLFINETKKSLQPKIIKFLISRFLSTGSFMGISFPVFAMKAESVLQSYCRCLSLAPRLFQQCKSPIQRIKSFNCFMNTLSIRFTDIDKSFNPTIGETFQAKIGHDYVYAEQISHHPPITAFLLENNEFTLHSSIEVQASMGFNSARGFFNGEIIVNFKDGGVVRGKMPSGILSGFLFGKYVFYPEGAVYSFDPINHIVCSYEVVKDDILRGVIGKLHHKNYAQFLETVNNKDPDKFKYQFSDFKHIPETHFEKIYSKMQLIWTKGISYDGKVMIDYQEEKWQPPKLIKQNLPNILPSDSRFRKDILLREQERMEESQEEKERIEQDQREFKKLKEKYQQ